MLECVYLAGPLIPRCQAPTSYVLARWRFPRPPPCHEPIRLAARAKVSASATVLLVIRACQYVFVTFMQLSLRMG